MARMELEDVVGPATRLAEDWLAATAADERPAERRTTARLAALVADPAGLELAVRFVDRVARPEDLQVAARELAALRPWTTAARGFLGRVDRRLLALGALVAPALPRVVVPAARARLRSLVGHLVADADDLGHHLAAARAQGFRLNLNLLGEAVLGEDEARSRLARVAALVRRPDVDHVSVKVSAVASQLSAWGADRSRDRVVERLLPLYRTARDHGTFLNLDMEEYRDLDLTLAVYERLLAEPDLRDAETGVALQAYLPDAHAAYDELVAIAARRRAQGGARVKVRLVKGANLAMERVEAELRGWPQAPYPTKAEVDASYLRLLDHALDPQRTQHVRVGVAGHNLFHLAAAHLLASGRGVTEAVDVEMLQGMAPAQARAVRDTVAPVPVVLYTPVVARADFDVAISYLVRRLEENAAPQNFLHAMFADGASGLAAQRAAFERAVADARRVSTRPRRTPRPPVAPDLPGFANTPDTDPAVRASRRWAAQVVARDVEAPALPHLTTPAAVDDVVARAARVAPVWAGAPPAERARVLRRVAHHLDAARADLVAVMVREARKTVAEADPEVSEAVDFARWYALCAEELAEGAVPGAVFRPYGVTVVTPPWNFPVAIPVGSVLAALAAGSPVVAKPAPQTPRCAAVAYAAVHRALDEAAVPRDVLQVVTCPEDEVGRRLVTHPDVARVLLTGSIETARAFASWRPDLDVLAETSGKNAVVVTPAADVDLAVADVVRSAFGHAGQKCSAASLLVLVGSAGFSARLRRQLADAVRSLAVGPADDLGTTVNPLVGPPSPALHRALTTLEPGERWLVRPEPLDGDGLTWRPGVRYFVRPGSWFHLTEVFGPVLGVMRVATLDEAVAVQNAVPFGLTGGIHSLDDAEVEHWLEHVEVGNAYVNRHVTGAVVRRQPFGGWKASVVGPGAKAGGPSYVAQLGRWADAPDVPTDDAAWLAWAEADDERWWAEHLGREHDPSGLVAEANVLRYRPVPHLTVRVGDGARDVHVARVLAAARRAGVPTTVLGPERSHADVAAEVRAGRLAGRIRVVGDAPGLRAAAVTRLGEVTVLDAPVVASARRELLTVVREQAVSRTSHRFGHVPGQVGPLSE